MINEKLLAKFLMDECTENELCEIKRWMDESNEHAFELFTIEEIPVRQNGVQHKSYGCR